MLTATISKGSVSAARYFTFTVFQADSPPDAPTNLAVVSQDATSVQLSWDEPIDTGYFDGSIATITAYTVYYSETTLAVVDLSTIPTTLNAGITNSAFVTGLDSNTEYYFVVTATNFANLKSEASEEVHQTTDKTEIDRVLADKEALDITFAPGDSISSVTQDFTLPTVGANTTTITWAVKSGTGITLSGNTGKTAVVTPSSTGNEVVVLTATISTGSLSDSKDFTVRVVRADAVPEAPENLTVQSRDATTVELSWDEPADTGFSGGSAAPITAYRIYYSETSLAGGDLSKATTFDAGTTNTVSVKGLTSNTEYYFVVTATNSANLESSASVEVKETTDLSDTEKVEKDKAALDITAAVGGDLQAVTTATITLPTTGGNGSIIRWAVTSGREVALSGTNGSTATVTRRNYVDGDASVKLKASISKGITTDSKDFDLVVLKKDRINASGIGSFTYNNIQITYSTAVSGTPTISINDPSLPPATVTYKFKDGQTIPTGITISEDGTVTVGSTTNAQSSTAYVIIATGTGNYEGSIEGSVSIQVDQKALTQDNFSYEDISTTYGTETSGTPKATVSGQTITYKFKDGQTIPTGITISEDGTVTVGSTTNAQSSTAYVITATGTANYTGDVDFQVKIEVLRKSYPAPWILQT